MNKKCIGCGTILQDKDELLIGYTPNINKEYCMRCFKLKNYGTNIIKNIEMNNDDILQKIENEKIFTIFLTDFINISNEVIKTYKKIKTKKMLVITKKDLLPKNIHENLFIANVKKTYGIEEKILFISIKDNLEYLKKIIENEKKVIFCGYTIAGKSTLINILTNSKIVASKEESTTLDLIKIENDDFTIFDSPGFIYNNYYKNIDQKKQIKPNIKTIKASQELKIDKFIIKSNVDNNLIFYIPNYINIVKRTNRNKLINKINVPINSDVLIKGLGFINVKKTCILSTTLDLELIEVRDSLVGKKYE